MHPRTGSRELAIILFCLLGIAVLNDFSHNRYRGFTDPRPLLQKVIRGSEFGRQYREKTLYEFLNDYAKDPKAWQSSGGVTVKGYILSEKAADISDVFPGSTEKVGKTFRLARRYSESGSEEGSTVLSVAVSWPHPGGLEPGMWIAIAGKVKPSPDDDSAPMIQAEHLHPLDHAPENPILSQQGEQNVPEMGGGGEEGHSH